ncbi:sugar-binding transcriptional regulator [Microvirga sp. 17 mud 1-3]|uniref:sugar-binding transcriptional regulator n=1 Tax=Microvirga sp. 17 mud 1-3 TaxID=2082949 RepID=UPI001FE1EBFB|nr:sugar-binding domain-containing protein [Microvirga sp. 17 mud 1-3]
MAQTRRRSDPDNKKRAKLSKFQADKQELKIRAAWHYFIEGLTQEQVAQQIGVSRLKALRLLAAARQDGTVQISINTEVDSIIRLQRALESHLGVSEVIIVPTGDQTEASVAAVVGHATGQYLSGELSNGMSVGVGWGATLKVCMQSLAQLDIEKLTVVSLLGGLTHATMDNPSAVAWRLADFYGTNLYQITAPVFVPEPEMARALWQLKDFQELIIRARDVDVALLSVGNVSEDASIFRRSILGFPEMTSLRRAGAVGDVLCHFVDADGEIIDHDVNRRVMAISPTAIRDVPKVVISSGGRNKARIIRAGVAATNASVLITDISAAEAILELPRLARTPEKKPVRRQSAAEFTES